MEVKEKQPSLESRIYWFQQMFAVRTSSVLPLATASLFVVGGCASDQGISELRFEDIAVATGDFDRAEDFLARNDMKHTVYEGFIVQSVYSADDDYVGSFALTSESLFLGENDQGISELMNYDAAFINSGTRGLGGYRYNGVESEDNRDDAFISDQLALDHVQDFLNHGRTLVISDWGYDLIEALWPDKISFREEAVGFDSAQVGTSETVSARVESEDLQEILDQDQVALNFDFTYWTVMESVAEDVDVYLRGDVTLRESDGTGYGDLFDVPLLVGFDAGGGRVYFSSFGWRAQKVPLTDAVLFGLVEGLQAGTDQPETPSDEGE